MRWRFHASLRRWPAGGGRQGAARLGVAVVLTLALGWLALGPQGLAQTMKTLAGGRLSATGSDAGFADGDSLQDAQFNSPMACALDAAGNLFVADTGNNAVRKLDFEAEKTRTVLTNLSQPVGVAFDRTNNLYVLNQGNGTILKFDRLDTMYRSPRVLAGGLSRPSAFVLDLEKSGSIYVTELGGAIKRVDPTNGAISLITVGFRQPQGIAVLESGLLAVSDTGNNLLRFVDPLARTNVAQVGTGAAGFRDGRQTEAQFNQPYGLARAADGTLVVADRLNHRVRLVNPAGLVSTLYGVDTNLWEGPCLNCTPIILPGWFDGINGEAATAEARDPVGVAVDNEGTLFSTEIYYHIIRRVTDTGLTPAGPANTNIVVLPPVISPASGYYPLGVEVAVADPNTNFFLPSQVFYTTDGSEPGPENPRSRLVVLTNNAATIRWGETTRDLTSLRVRTFLGSVGGPSVSGQPVGTNAVGLASEVTAGIGATALIPVVANLKPGQALKSLQFLAEIAPVPPAPPLSAPVRVLPMSPNDFVPVVSASTNTPLTRSDTAGGAFRLEIAFVGTNAAFNVNNFAVVTMLAVTVPSSARVGDKYELRVAAPSGTSDGVDKDVPLVSLPPQRLLATNQSYLVGDSTPAVWYNAGGFGDGQLKNNDVNNALYASLGVRVPPFFTDVFDAMDTFPEDTIDGVGGDSKIRFLDWQVLLDRSLGFRTNNWTRSWSAGGRVATLAPGASRPLRPGEMIGASGSSYRVQLERFRAQALLAAGSVAQAQPGARVRVPLRLSVTDGLSLAGLQFRATVQAHGLAPGLTEPVQFVRRADLPEPFHLAALPPNQVCGVWSPLLNPLAGRLAGQVELGAVEFVVPASAEAGDCYRVELANVDGAPDLQTQCSFASQPASVAVQAPAPTQVSQPYRLSWWGQAGKRYVVESCTELTSGRWEVEAADLLGRDGPMEFVDEGSDGDMKFYRVELMP